MRQLLVTAGILLLSELAGATRPPIKPAAVGDATLRPLLLRAQKLLRRGEIQPADRLLARARRSAPRNPAVQFTVGLWLAQARQYAAAARAFAAAARLAGGYASYYNLGLCQSHLRHWRRAHDAYFHALDARARAFDPNLHLGMDYLARQRPWRAIPWLLKAQTEAPANPRVQRLLGIAYLQAGYEKSAAAALRRLAPRANDARVWTALGTAYARLGQYKRARRAFRRALALYPHLPLLQFSAAEMDRLLDHPRRAARQYRKLLRQSPDYAPAWAQLGGLALRAGRREAAARDLSRALALAPNQPMTRYRLSQVRLQQRHPRAALRLLQPLLRQQPENYKFLYAEARCYLRLGQTARGQAILRRFRQLRQATLGQAKLQAPLVYLP